SIRPRNSRESWGGNISLTNFATLASAARSTRRRGSTCAARSERATLTAKTAVKIRGKADLCAEAGERPAGAAVEAPAILDPLQLRVLLVAGVEVREEVATDLVGCQIEVHAASADADDAREVRERKLDTMQVHQQRLARLVGEIAQKRDDRHGEGGV